MDERRGQYHPGESPLQSDRAEIGQFAIEQDAQNASPSSAIPDSIIGKRMLAFPAWAR
jgi:hypothetical protein